MFLTTPDSKVYGLNSSSTVSFFTFLILFRSRSSGEGLNVYPNYKIPFNYTDNSSLWHTVET